MLSSAPLIGVMEWDFIEKRMNDPNFDPWGVDEEEVKQIEVVNIKEEVEEENYNLGGDEEEYKYDEFDQGAEYHVVD